MDATETVKKDVRYYADQIKESLDAARDEYNWRRTVGDQTEASWAVSARLTDRHVAAARDNVLELLALVERVENFIGVKEATDA